jgi:class 3 adenylate cyclase/ketosteroid isomerase-like protein
MEHSPELEALARRIVDGMDGATIDINRDVFTRDEGATSIGTDPNEVVQGYAGIVALFEQQAAERGEVGAVVRGADDLEVHAYRVGDAGWAAVFAMGTGRDGKPFVRRTTLVFQLEGTQWKVVHDHWSVGVPNEELLGLTLTTSIDDLADRIADLRPDVSTAASADGAVTLLFSDIEGSTSLLSHVGDHRYKSILQWHNQVARDALAEAAGLAVNWQGDGFVFAFESPERALRCAFAIQHSIDRGHADYPVLRLRMGIHTGEVLRERNEFYGRVVHYAARVASVAEGGQVLCSDVVRQLLARGGEWVFTRQPPKQFKGFEGNQTVFAVTRRDDQRS